MFNKIYSKVRDLKYYGISYFRIAIYAFSGFLGMGTNIFLLYLLTSVFGLWYLLSGVISFTCSVFVGFFLHKEFTFNDKVKHRINKKLILFFLVAIANLVINTLLLYFLTDIMDIFYILSQVIASILVASWSYLIYYKMVFDVDCA